MMMRSQGSTFRLSSVQYECHRESLRTILGRTGPEHFDKIVSCFSNDEFVTLFVVIGGGIECENIHMHMYLHMYMYLCSMCIFIHMHVNLINSTFHI